MLQRSIQNRGVLRFPKCQDSLHKPLILRVCRLHSPLGARKLLAGGVICEHGILERIFLLAQGCQSRADQVDLASVFGRILEESTLVELPQEQRVATRRDTRRFERVAQSLQRSVRLLNRLKLALLALDCVA